MNKSFLPSKSTIFNLQNLFSFVRQQFIYLYLYLRKSSLLLSVFALTLIIFEINVPVVFYFFTKSHYEGLNLFHIFFYMISTLIFLLGAPLFLNLCFYKEKLTRLGWLRPTNRIITLSWIALALILTLPMMLYVANMPSFQNYYSLHKPSYSKLIFILIVVLPFYYVCEEFFFRGFLFLNLWRRVGWHSFWITDILFMFAHIGKPMMEIVLSFPVGTVLAFLTLRTKSIYPAMFVHYILGVTMLLAVNQVI